VVRQHCAASLCGTSHLDRQPGIVGLAFEVPEAAGPPTKAWDGLLDPVGTYRPVAADVPPGRQQVVPGQPGPVQSPARKGIRKHIHRYRADQVGGQPEQSPAFPQGLMDQAEIAMLEVPETAVDQS